VPGNFVNITKAKIICFFLVLLGGTNIINSAQEAHGQKIVELQSDPNVKQLKPLMHKGKPFFPIGAYGQTRLRFPTSTGSLPFLPLAILREQGWNTVLQHVSDDTTDKTFLINADSAGFAVILSMHNLVAAQKHDEVAKKVSALKDYPAVLGYYIFDDRKMYIQPAKNINTLFIQAPSGWESLSSTNSGGLSP